MELYRTDELKRHSIPTDFAQENVSVSKRDVVRGLHMQHGQGKLLTVMWGRVQFVELDVRLNSPTFGEHFTTVIVSEEPKLLWVPPGFANGFCVLSDEAVVAYKCTEVYNSALEVAIHPFDPSLHIQWSVADAVMSSRDKSAPYLHQISLHPENNADNTSERG